jgi:ribonucleoside-diphosphate reductase beta chain
VHVDENRGAQAASGAAMCGESASACARVTRAGLDRTTVPMRLWQRSKTHGLWNPDHISFAADRADWERLSVGRRHRVLQLCTLFEMGEEAVTLDLLPLLRVVASEGRLEEELYLTAFLFEEAKHVDLFDRFFAEVTGAPAERARYQYPSYERIVAVELPAALRALEHDRSPEAQVRASVTYHFVVEGVLAETGYYLFRRMLTEQGIMPGLQRAIALMRRDESRHIAFGVYFLRRLVLQYGDRAYGAFLARLSELRPLVEDSTRHFMSFLEGEHAFGISTDDLLRVSRKRFARRLQQVVDAHVQTRRQARAPHPCPAEAPHV